MIDQISRMHPEDAIIKLVDLKFVTVEEINKRMKHSDLKQVKRDLINNFKNLQ